TVPDEHVILFTLEATDGSNTWISNFSITAHAPVLEFGGFNIDDTMQGNGNFHWDPGETVDIIITISNTGSSVAFNVSGELLTEDPYVTINETGAISYGDIPGYSSSEQPFNATADLNTPQSHFVTLNINFTASGGISESEFFDIQIGGYLIEEYFDTWLPMDWSATSSSGQINWVQGTGCNAGGTPPEAQFHWAPITFAVQRLISKPVNTTGMDELVLEFKHCIDHFESTYQLRLETTSDSGSTWNVVQTWPAQDLSSTTEQIILDDNNVGSPNFQLAWVFEGNSWNINYWYIDDVILGEVIPGYIEGTVTLDGGSGNVQNVIVTAGDVTTNPDEFGEYSLELNPGSYDVTAELGNYISQTITGIDVSAGLITPDIDFILPEGYPPSNLIAEVVCYNDVHLEWDQPVLEIRNRSVHRKTDLVSSSYTNRKDRNKASYPDDTRELLGYNIYSNNELIYEITNPNETTYDDLALSTGEYEYYVTSVYNAGESYPSNVDTIYIALTAPQNPHAETSGLDIIVTWEMPSTRGLSHYKIFRDLSLIANNIEDSLYLDLNVTAGEYTYNIKAVYDGGYESPLSPDAFIIHEPTNAENNLIPNVTELIGNYPNPFNPTTTISF
ncbi:MAG: carboxypeptidase-like regulatory domain-containing protein, partial [Candidatus Cloacimonetes bacterium]|nr:carboxypeptidase-like regulatory domain-containing protein [Candidatus Cloacimonadota bacterium]